MTAGVIQGFFLGGGFKGHGDGRFALDPRAIGLARTGGKPLPTALLAKMETAFKADFSRVRVHEGPQAGRIGALAFTMGEQLYFAPGQFQPGTARGEQLIGHELAHVIQQRQGRVRAAGGGIAVVQDRALEAEADRLGLRAAAAASRPGIAVQRAAATSSSSAPKYVDGVVPAKNPIRVPQVRLPSIRPVPIQPRVARRTIVQRTSLASIDGSSFNWITQFSVQGLGDKTGAIIQEAGHLFGTGARVGQNVTRNIVFFEFFPVAADGSSGSDQFASDLSRAADPDYCMLAGKLYFISAYSPDFRRLRASFRTNNPAAPRGINMLACMDLPADLSHALGQPLAQRSLLFIRRGRDRARQIVIKNSSEGQVRNIMDMDG